MTADRRLAVRATRVGAPCERRHGVARALGGTAMPHSRSTSMRADAPRRKPARSL